MRDSRTRLCCVPWLVVAAALVACPAMAGETRDERTENESETQEAARVVQRYCLACHGDDVQEAGIRLDRLELAKPHARDGATFERMWQMVRRGKMPPDGADAPAPAERALLVSRLEDGLTALAREARRSGRRTRRLTVEEYNYTMQALFNVDAQFADLLPADPISPRGYRNASERLRVSSLRVEAYLDSARRAVRRYVGFGPLKERALRYHIELEDLFYATADRYETRKRAPQPLAPGEFAARRTANRAAPPQYVDPLGPMLPGAFTEDESLRAAIPKLHQQYLAIPERLAVGEMIVRVRAAGTADRDGRFPRMRVEAGITLGDGCSIDKRVLGEVDVTAPRGGPATYTFRIRLEDVPTKGPLSEGESYDRLSVFDMDQVFISNVSCDSKAVFARGRGGYKDPSTGSEQIAGALARMAEDGVPFLHLDSVEIEMFPGAGRDNAPYRWQVGLDQADDRDGPPPAVARDLLRHFMRRAYRRPVTAAELEGKVQLFRTLREQGWPFEESLRETLAAVLVAPPFLFLELTAPGEDAPTAGANAHRLASRLSYGLWLSPPDETLTRRAEDLTLLEPAVFRGQAERLLADPRHRRFLESFCRQWLRLDKHANVAVDRRVYPTYDDDLADLAVRETIATFVHVFDSETSALDLIDADYAVLNDRLAAHYGIGDVKTGNLTRVRLPKGSVRGGLLTQASVLTMNSDGVDSHPIRRGVWLLDRIMDRPPPPPPDNVPEIDGADPDFRGLSLRQQIELHRRPGQCRSCHERIDPWGMPFERFDATGRWRERVANGEDGELSARPVRADTRLPDGRRIDGMVALKRYIRRQQRDAFAAALAHHLLTYTLGRPPDFIDRHEVREIQRRFAASDYRLKELVLAIVESPLFRRQEDAAVAPRGARRAGS